MTFNKPPREKMPEGYLTGTLFFGSLHYPNNKFRELKYVLQLGLEGEELEKAKKMNLSIKAPSKHVDMPHVEIKRRVKSEATKPPRVIDINNNDIPNTVLVGNGSKVKVKFGMYDNTKGKNGAYLDTVKVLDLVEYTPRSEDANDFYTVDGDAGDLQGTDSYDKVSTGPTKTGSAKRAATRPVPNDMDDEIPF